MRTKTLIIEDPVFDDDAEHAFGDTLSKWEDFGAGGVAAAALEGKIAEHRLQHATRKVLLDKSPERLLDALDAVLRLYEDIQHLESTTNDKTEKEYYQNSLQFVQQIALQLGHGYLTAVGGGGGGDNTSSSTSSPPSSQALASLASVLARHESSSEWTVGFIQPGPLDIVSILLTLADERETTESTATSSSGGGKIKFSPVALVRILTQLDIFSAAGTSQLTAAADAHLLPRALVDLIPLEQQQDLSNFENGNGSVAAIAVTEICIAIQKLIVQLAVDTTNDSASRNASVAEALLELLLAASKGISTSALRQQEQEPPCCTTISNLADWIFAFRPRSAVNRTLILQIVSSLPWEWLAVQCPRKLRLKFMVAAVAAVKALHDGDSRDALDSTSSGGVHALSEILSSKTGWNLATGCFTHGENDQADQEEEEQGRMLCLLEAPPSEPAAVLLLWRQVQATVALALCTTWMQSTSTKEGRRLGNSSSESIKEDIATLLEGARVPDALTQMVQSGHSTAAVSLVSYAINSAASAPEFLSAVYPTLSLTLSAALGSATTATAASTATTATATAAITIVEVLEKGISEAVQACRNEDNEDSFTSVVAWLGLFVGVLAQRDGLSSILESPVFSTLIAKITRTVYCLLNGQSKLAVLLLHLANALRDQPRSHTQQLIAQLLSGGGGGSGGGGSSEVVAWLRVLGAWIADASSLSSKLPQQGTDSWSISDAEAALQGATTTTTAAGAGETSSSPDEAEAAANEVFLLQDAIQTIKSTAPIPAMVLCYELFYRISKNYSTLSPLLDRQELTSVIGSLSQKLEVKSPEVATLVTSLLKILDNEGEIEQLMLFIGDFSVVEKVAIVLAPSWVEADFKASFSSTAAAGAVPIDSLSRHFTASVSLAEETSAASAGVVPSSLFERKPFPSSSVASASDRADFFIHQQEELATSLAAAQEELRYWVRQGEKAAARDEGEEPLPDHGKEGDIPQPLATAQRHLWELEQRQKEELSHLHAALRQKICQQYNPIDEQFLQEASEAFNDDDRIPRAMLFRDAQHSVHCRNLRNQAFEVALNVNSAKELSLAAKALFTFEYLLLEAVEKGEATQERAAIRSKLLAVMAHSLVDGSTPVTAIPYMVSLFERAVTGGGIVLDTDAKLRLIPRIAASLSNTGGGGGNVVSAGSNNNISGGESGNSVLREKEGMRLLNACLDPDALLNAGKLREFMTALQLIIKLSVQSSGDGGRSGEPSVMLSSFDAQRFAVLVAEKPGAVRATGGGGSSSAGGSSSSSSSATAVAAAASSSRNKVRSFFFSIFLSSFKSSVFSNFLFFSLLLSRAKRLVLKKSYPSLLSASPLHPLPPPVLLFLKASSTSPPPLSTLHVLVLFLTHQRQGVGIPC
jgi:hypothetical protein